MGQKVLQSVREVCVLVVEQTSAAEHPAAFGHVSVDVIPAEDAIADPAVHDAWDAAVRKLSSPNAMYASPIWCEHLLHANADVRVAIVRESAGAIIGIVPVRISPYTLTFDIWSRVLARRSFLAATLLGGE